MITLGIESSCDETSVALLDNEIILANEIYSQAVHARFGGVVPEIASRAHLAKIDRLCAAVFHDTGLSPPAIDQIAVTDSPGLAGALLVGISFALGLHASYKIPLCGVNHLEGHICSVLFEKKQPAYPFLALVVSGGHTAIYQVEKFGRYRCMGRTVDDAAGEAFDKVGKLLGFEYPAGRSIDQEARRAHPDYDIKFPIAHLPEDRFDFSFSGLKTAVKYFIAGKNESYLPEHRPEICHAFQKAVVGSLVRNITAASRHTGITDIVCVGGVACNSQLRMSLRDVFGDHVFFPSPPLCTDNAAMIARAGYERAMRGATTAPHMAPSRELEQYE